MPLTLLFNTEDPGQAGLLNSFSSTGSANPGELVRGDINLSLTLRPVIPSVSGTRPWDDDHDTGDTYGVAIGNTDEAPESGDTIATFDDELTSGLLVTGKRYRIKTWNAADDFTNVGAASNASGVVFTATGTTPGAWANGSILTQITIDIAPDITAAALKSAIESADSGSYGLVQVTLITAGTYELRWLSDGAVPQLIFPTNDFSPSGTAVSIVENAGDGDSQAVQILVFRQSPVAFSEPATALPVASVLANVAQSGSGSQNKIYTITMTDGTYSGTFSVSLTNQSGLTETVGIATPNTTESEWLALLATHSTTDSDDFAVSKSGGIVTVELKGSLALSNTPAISVTNINLLAPVGVTGMIQLNTVSLYRAFWNSGGEEELTFTLEIRRTRSSGEERVILQVPITLKRNIIDVLTMIPVALPTYLSAAESLVQLVNSGPGLGIAGLTGGGSTKLDGIVVTGAMLGRIVFVNDPTDGPHFWVLETDAGSEDVAGTGTVKPDNDATKSWKRRG